MFFSRVIGEVGFGRFPVDIELTLVAPIAHPIDSHIGALEVFSLHGFIEDTPCGGIVSFDGGRALWVAHIFKRLSEQRGFTCVEADGAYFCLGGRRVDVLDDLSEGAHRGVEEGTSSVPQKMVTSRSASRFRRYEADAATVNA